MNVEIKLAAKAAAVFVIESALILTTNGQSGNTPRRPDPLQREIQRQLENEVMERALERGPRKVTARDPRLSLMQIREDFMRIQVVNYELAKAVSHGGTLDFRYVAKSASDIKKRAERLKDNLMLPESGPSPGRLRVEDVQGPEQLRSSLSSLAKLIVGFVNNPVLKDANVIDAELSVKARRDLDEIIELSGHVKRSSEKLNKATEKSH